MAQVTSGIRAVLSNPAIYSIFQKMLGAEVARRKLCLEYIRAQPGDIIVDVGCGPADILNHLDGRATYFGFDLSQAYIDSAVLRFPDRGTFSCCDVASLPLDEIPPCQIAIAIGVLHHLDDEQAAGLIKNLHARLAPGGRLITMDPAYWPSQARIGRYLVSKDRGQNVRSGDGYKSLASPTFDLINLIRRDDLLNIPYSHAILECTK